MHVAVRKGYEGKGYARELLKSAVQKVISMNKKLKLSMYSDEGKKKLESLIIKLSAENSDIIIPSK
jgi:predicted GNAT family acetyltransferase